MAPEEEEPKREETPGEPEQPPAEADAAEGAPSEPDAPQEDVRDDEPLYDPSRPQAPAPPPRSEPPPPRYGAEIPLPGTNRLGGVRAREARINLDLDLGRIKRRKRFGLFISALGALFVAFVLAPVMWAGAYLFFDPPTTVLMMQRAAEGQTIRHYPVAITRMSPHIVRAVIAAEDSRFCSHDGFDVEAIQNAMRSNAEGGRLRGASTISQQTAKNLFLWPDRSWLRKGLETYFTALIEFMWPKRRIMEAYLNAAEWGDGNFGIEAAARARFGVSAADLSPLQAARLAAVLPSPNRYSADHPGPYVRRLAASIVARARVVRDEHLAACVLGLDRPR